MEAFLINLKIHLVFTILTILFTLVFGLKDLLIGYGWFPIIIVYEFYQSTIDP